MSKFKVGDKVKIIKNKNQEYIGDIVTIMSINPNAPYLTEPHYGVGRVFVMCEDELELVESKPFTKSDLKDGMVVEFRDGDRRILLNGHLMTNNSVLDTYHFTEDLQHQFDDFTIDKVYTSNAKFGMNYFKDEYLDLIWEREIGYKEMTIEEIEKIVGHKIKVVGDNSCQK